MRSNISRLRQDIQTYHFDKIFLYFNLLRCFDTRYGMKMVIVFNENGYRFHSYYKTQIKLSGIEVEISLGIRLL